MTNYCYGVKPIDSTDHIGTEWRGVVKIDNEWWSFKLDEKMFLTFLSTEVRKLEDGEVINLQRAPSLPILRVQVDYSILDS